MGEQPKIHKNPACRKFIEAAGHATQSLGLGRILGQIFALLYLNPKPLCLDEIALELGVSKASVSITVRQLDRLAAVKRVWVKGDRKDYYEAETEFRAVIRHGLLETLRRKFDTAGQQVANVEDSLQQALHEADGEERQAIQVIAERLQKAKQFHNKMNGLLTNPLLDQLL